MGFRAPLSLAAAVLPILLLGAGCDRAVPDASAHTAAPVVRPVRVMPVERGPVERPIRASGLVAARYNADLSFKVGGVVSAVLVEDGARVKKGQVLARVDPTELSAGAEQARRSLDKAKRDLERAKALFAERTLARADLEGAETAAAIATSAHTAAAFNERHTVLVAPTDGIVERRLVEPGEVAAPGRPVVRFLGTQRGWVIAAAVSDRDALRVVPGTPARVVLDATPDTPIDGMVTDVARLSNPRTGTFDVEVTLPATLPFEPKAGLVAKLTLPRTERPPATVPLAALVDGDGDRAFVFVVEGDRAKRVPVRVAFLAGDRAALRDDVAGVTAVVVEGQTDIVDGAAVRVTEPPTWSSPAPSPRP